MVSGQPEHDSACGGVPIRRLRARPIGHEQESVGSRGETRGGRLQQVDVLEPHAEALGIERGDALEEPVHRVRPALQERLHRVGPGDGPDQRAKRPVPRIALARAAGNDRRPEIQVRDARPRRVRAEARRLPVSGPAHHRQTSGEAEPLGRGDRQLADPVAGGDQRRDALAREPDERQEVVRPVLAIHVDQAERVRACGRRPPRPRQPAHEKGMDVDDPAGAPDRLGLVLAQPAQLVQRGGDIRRLAGEPVDVVGPKLLDRAGGPDVHPDDGRPHGPSVLIDARERLALMRQPDRLDLGAVDRSERPAHGTGGGAPPVLGVLLVPARTGDGQRELGAPIGDGAAIAVPHDGLRRGCRRIDPDDVRHLANLRLRSPRVDEIQAPGLTRPHAAEQCPADVLRRCRRSCGVRPPEGGKPR
jgi:hypothetical protein